MFLEEAHDRCLVRVEVSTTMGLWVLLEAVVGQVDLKAGIEGAELVVASEFLSLKTEKGALVEVLKEDRVDWRRTLAAAEEVRALLQVVRCVRELNCWERAAICFCLGDGFLGSDLMLNGFAWRCLICWREKDTLTIKSYIPKPKKNSKQIEISKIHLSPSGF